MLLELIKSYKLKIEDLKARGLRGERALIIVSFLKDEAKFKTINIKELLELLQTANYTTHPLNKIGTTLEYIARNNLYSSSNYKSILTSVISSLETLKLESFNQEETDKLLERLTKLENSIIDDSVFITDFPLVKQIIRESNLAPIDIYNLMLEIDKFNKNTVGLDNIDKHTLIMNLLHKYGYNPDLTEYEKSLIDTIDLNLLEEKLDYFASIEDYDFLKTSIEHHRLVLLLLAPINNIKEIYRITLDSNLKVENIFGIFYFNKDYRLPDTGRS